MYRIQYSFKPQNEIERSSIAAMVAKYLEEGGKIDELPGFQHKPFSTVRSNPVPLERRPSERRHMSIDEENALFAKLSQLSHMTRSQAIEAAGITPEIMDHMTATFDLQFYGRPNIMPQYSERDDLIAADRMRAFAALGLSKSQVRNRMQIGFERLNRIAEKYGISFVKVTP